MCACVCVGATQYYMAKVWQLTITFTCAFWLCMPIQSTLCCKNNIFYGRLSSRIWCMAVWICTLNQARNSLWFYFLIYPKVVFLFGLRSRFWSGVHKPMAIHTYIYTYCIVKLWGGQTYFVSFLHTKMHVPLLLKITHVLLIKKNCKLLCFHR